MCYKRPALCQPEREKLDLFELVGDGAEKEKNDENGGGVWVDLFDLFELTGDRSRGQEGSVWVVRGGGAVIHHHQVVIKHQRQARYLGKYLWLKVRKETIIAVSWQNYRTCKNLILYHCPRWRVSNILSWYSEVADNLRGLDRKWDLYRKELWLQCQMCIYKRELIECAKEDSEPSAYD